ncbi:uncharacterized protein LOC127148535 isoform X2 [Cucumis melo]|uniref:Uncharacterized protein LOC127148535 isoform X2 n=1 Tax=Cucumis melo TaxID=3656 RepID=A0ABM3KLB4_CUCME|nr:uncharacterized protein LOC127148535 isoform X2 [Cucumis melo]
MVLTMPISTSFEMSFERNVGRKLHYVIERYLQHQIRNIYDREHKEVFLRIFSCPKITICASNCSSSAHLSVATFFSQVMVAIGENTVGSGFGCEDL